MPIKTPWTYTEVAKLNRENAAFTQSQYQDLVFSCTKDPILARLLSLFPPETCHNASFKTKYNRARDLHQEVLQRQNRPTNVHDPLFGGIREKTKAWLQKTVASLPVSSSTTSSSSSSSSASSASSSGSSSLVDTLVKSFSAFLSSEKEIRANQEAFFGYLAQSYETGATGKQSLEQALAYCASGKDETERKHRYEILFVSLEQARTAYEGSSHKYVTAAHRFSQGKARDWSCMPGVEERILDGCTPWFEEDAAKKPAAASSSTEGDFIAPLLAQLVHPFLSKQAQGLVPTKAFYSLVVQAVARCFNWRIEVTEDTEYQLVLEQEQATQREKLKNALHTQKTQKKERAEQLLSKLKTEGGLAALSKDEKTDLSQFVTNLNAPLFSIKNSLQYEIDQYSVGTSEEKLEATLQELLKRRYSSQKEAEQQLKHAFIQEEMSSLIQPVTVPKLGFSKAASSSSSARSGKDEADSSSSSQPSSSSSQARGMLQEEEPEDTLTTLDSQRLLTLLENTTPQLSSEHWQLLASILPFETFIAYFLEGKADYFDPSLKIDSFLSTLQDQLLAAELQTQAQTTAQTHTPFYRYYAQATPVLLKHIQDQVLTEIRRDGMGVDYFYNLLAPCQEALMIKLIPAYLDELAKDSLNQQSKARVNLEVWLGFLGYRLANSIYYLITAKLDTPENHQALLAADANAEHVALGLKTLSEVKLLTSENRQALVNAGANAEHVAHGLKTLSDAKLLTPENRQALVNAGANAKHVVWMLRILSKEKLLLLTQDIFQALFDAGENAEHVALGLETLSDAKLLTSENCQALVNAGENAEHVAHGLETLSEAKLLTPENRQALVNAGANASVQARAITDAVENGIQILKEKNLLTPEIHKVLLNARANANKVAKETAAFYNWQRYSILKKSLLATLIIGVVSVISFSLLAATVITTLLGTGLFLVLNLRLRQLLPFVMKAAAQALAVPSSSVEGPLFSFGKQSAPNTLSGFFHYYQSFCNPRAYSSQWDQGFAEGCREQWKNSLRA